jgi:uncharacterized protein YdaU (DUF1376 family)
MKMSTSCVGAYILLLCEAWTRPGCSLPSARLALQKLARWDRADDEFGPVMDCFTPVKGDKTRVINARLKQCWDDAMATRETFREAGKRGAQIKKQLQPPTRNASPLTRRTRRVAQSPHEWITAIHTNPLYAHINLPREIAKAEQWIADHPGRTFTKSFLVKWLNKIEPPITNGANPMSPLTCPDHPGLTFHTAKEKATHDFCHHPKYVG